MALTGARGMSEYISRSADLGTNSGGLTLNSQIASDSKTLSIFFPFLYDTSYNTLLYFIGATNTNHLYISEEAGKIHINSSDTTGTLLDKTTSTTTMTTGVWYNVFINIDMTDINKLHIYINNINQAFTGSLYTNRNIPFNNITSYRVGIDNNSTYDLQGNMSGTYFTTDYIDFSQESNRNKFVNQLGWPRQLDDDIAKGNIPTPLIYLPFDDPSNLGKNLGTGGNFTVNGTVTAGADFSL